MQPTQVNPLARRIVLAVIAVLALGGIAVLIMYALNRPQEADFQAAQSSQITEATKARKSLIPAVNTYLAAFKAAYNESKSVHSASEAAKKEYDAFKAAASKASSAMKTLSDSRIANDSEVGVSVKQLKQDYDAEVAFYTGLVESYPEYTTLFAEGSGGCSGIFVGETNGLADRKKKLDAAAAKCNEALATLKKSSNSSYAEYAKKVEHRVKRMQADAATVLKAEQTLKQYEKRAEDYKQQYAEATARGASEEEILKLADELKKFNAQIADNRASFDFASKNYLKLVKEMPELYSSVYGTDVPAKQKHYNQLIEFRTSVLKSLVESKLV